ncbi:MAG: molybdate ABC transporter substrate-binding protein [Alphaproteobacteria bacterium]|nr:molybdate ABC transporter substrate-binding protein [Alphaproteobacteria bacterium]
MKIKPLKPRHLFAFAAYVATMLLPASAPSTWAEDPVEEPLIIFAAASLTDVLATHAEEWAARTESPLPRLSFGPSGTMARQIASGAPADLFISANQSWISFLQENNGLAGPPVAVAGNSLVLVVPGRHTIPSGAPLDAALLLSVVGDGRLAIADPANAPAGIYAKDLMMHLGVWNTLNSQLAYGGSARQTLLLAERGNLPAIVYKTDARMSRLVTSAAVAPDVAITYQAVLVKAGKEDASSFMNYLASDAASPGWTGFGFSVADNHPNVPK